MKRLTKLIATVVTIIAIFFAANVKAQTTAKSPWRLGIGLEAGIPTGDITGAENFELGGTVRLQYNAGPNFAYTLTSGYYYFFAKNYPPENGFSDKGENFSLVPLKAGIKYFFSSNLYFGAEAGVGFETRSGDNIKLILSPTLGFAKKTWDVGLRYENLSGNVMGSHLNYGIVGLRLAYAIPL